MYVPTEIDVQWAYHTLQMLADHSMLVFPSSGLRYKVDKGKKTLTLDNPEQLADVRSRNTHMMSVSVFAAVGYLVTATVDDLTKAAILFEDHLAECKICGRDFDICKTGGNLLHNFYLAVIDAIRKETTNVKPK